LISFSSGLLYDLQNNTPAYTFPSNIMVSERSLASMYSNVKICRSVSKNLSIETGVEYQKWLKEISFEGSNTIPYFENGIIVESLNLITGETTNSVKDSVKGTATENRKIRHTNTHQLIGIPIQFGWNIQKEKWLFGGSAGTMISLWTGHTGKYYNEKGNVLNLSNSRGEFFNNFGLSLTGSALIGYQISSKLNIVGEAGMTYWLTNWRKGAEAKPSYPLGLRTGLGIQYRF
jgi:hypothetical protein